MKKIIVISFNIFVLLLIGASLNYIYINLHNFFYVIMLFILLYFLFLLRYKSYIYQFLKYISSIIERLDNNLLFFILICISFFTKLFAAYFYKISLITEGTDTYVYVQSAIEMVKNGSVTTYANYSLDNPHLFFFSLVLSPWIKIFGHSQISLTCYMILIMTLSLLIIFDIFIFNKKKSIGFIACLIYLLLPSTILMPQYITHEIPFFFISLNIDMDLYKILSTI